MVNGAVPPVGAAGGDLSGTYPNPTLNLVGGAATSGDYARGNGTSVVLSAIQAADLPTGTTSAQGALQLDGTASDIQPLGTAAAGAKGQAADAEHVHPTTGVMVKVAATATAGVALTTGTPTILTFTTPNDGNNHYIQIICDVHIASNTTGGGVQWTFTDPAGSALSPNILSGTQSAGAHHDLDGAVVGPNTVVSISQSSSLTGGAGTVYGAILMAT